MIRKSLAEYRKGWLTILYSARQTFGQVAPDDTIFGQVEAGFSDALMRPRTFTFD